MFIKWKARRESKEAIREERKKKEGWDEWENNQGNKCINESNESERYNVSL